MSKVVPSKNTSKVVTSNNINAAKDGAMELTEEALEKVAGGTHHHPHHGSAGSDPIPAGWDLKANKKL